MIEMIQYYENIEYNTGIIIFRITVFFVLIPEEFDCWCIIRWIFISTEMIVALFDLMAGCCSTEMLLRVVGSDL